MKAFAFIFTALFGFTAWSATQKLADYPAHWWKPVPRDTAPDWEILPQDAGPGEVILSKRNELGILSNFAPTAFKFEGKQYASLEGFWQMMKYPEGPKDARLKDKSIQWPYTRDQVAQMTAFDAKKAGSVASKNMEKLGINWVTYKGRKMDYRVIEKGTHYDLIKRAMGEKLAQNQDVKNILLQTGDLLLRPDHKQDDPTPPAWKYHEIWMEYRAELLAGKDK
ncbi:MAG: NADAR family protein [Bdellovibrionales bacterium]|nr:NADAR family protein [Bdellovibrionales bacterium]